MNPQNRIRTAALAMMVTAGLATTACGDAIGFASEAETETEITCANCGVIRTITPRKVKGEAGPAAAIAGAVVGGALGNQFGKGSGKDAATIAGAIGGAIAGSEVDRQRKATVVHDLVIEMESGEMREITVSSVDGLSVNSEVRVTGEQVTAL